MTLSDLQSIIGAIARKCADLSFLDLNPGDMGNSDVAFGIRNKKLSNHTHGSSGKKKKKVSLLNVHHHEKGTRLQSMLRAALSLIMYACYAWEVLLSCFPSAVV